MGIKLLRGVGGGSDVLLQRMDDKTVDERVVFRVKLLGSDNKTVVEVIKFFNVKIKNVGGISLQYDGGDTAKFDLIFTSTYWEIEKSTEGGLLGQK